MTVAGLASRHCKKAVKLGLSLFGPRFNSSKCKTIAKMAVARIKLLRNKRQVVVRQMRRDIAILLESKQDATARVRVEHVIREQNIMEANEFIELFCELIVARLPIIAKQRDCPADLKEGISSLIFAAPRCSDIPELSRIRDVFIKKYGKDFVSAATDLRPNAGVNLTLIDKLSVRTPSGEVKLKVMKEIAKEFQVEWDTKESENELLKPPEERIEGPTTFVSATSLPIKPIPSQPIEQNHQTSKWYHGNGESSRMEFENSASAAEAAAESAKKAMAAAQVAAYLAGKEQQHAAASSFHDSWSGPSVNSSQKSTKLRRSSGGNSHNPNDDDDPDMRKSYRRHSYNDTSPPSVQSHIKFDESNSIEEEMEVEQPPPPGGIGSRPPLQTTTEIDVKKKIIHRRHSYNNNNTPSSHSDIKFDESDCEEDEMESSPSNNVVHHPPSRPAPLVPPPRVHPKLPDYDSLAARFEALKCRKS